MEKKTPKIHTYYVQGNYVINNKDCIEERLDGRNIKMARWSGFLCIFQILHAVHDELRTAVLSHDGIMGNLLPGGFSRSRNYVYTN